MNSIRTIGVLLIHVTVMVTACSSDNDPKAKSSTTASIGGSSNLQNTGGTAAQSTNATSSGGTSPLNTGGSSAASQDAGTSDASADGSVPVAAPSIVGIYTDGYFEHRITSDTWYMDTSTFHITIVNNSEDFLIALADSKNLYFANLWNRFDWNIDSSNVLRICETAYNAATERDALNTLAANAQDFDKGCGGFSWSVLTPIQNGDAGTDAGN